MSDEDKRKIIFVSAGNHLFGNFNMSEILRT